MADATTTVGPLLARLGRDAHAALADGRLFVGKRRAASSADHVEAGEEVVVYAPRVTHGEVIVLGEREGIVAVAKPADLASVADHHGRTGSLVQALIDRFGARARSWEPTSRLDVGVSGVVLFAARPQTRAWLTSAREQGTYRRHYVAIAARPPSPASGPWDWPIGRAANPMLRAVGGPDARAAHTLYAVRATASSGAVLLAVEPQTGRTHQIRVHAAHAGAPLVGDPAYSGLPRLTLQSGAVLGLRRIALHAAWVEVPLPSTGERWRVEAPVGDDLGRIWEALGGDSSAWPAALAPC